MVPSSQTDLLSLPREIRRDLYRSTSGNKQPSRLTRQADPQFKQLCGSAWSDGTDFRANSALDRAIIPFP